MSYRLVLQRRLWNAFQTAALLGAMGLLAAGVGWALFGIEGLVWAVFLAAIGMAFGSGLPPRFVMGLVGAQEIDAWQAPHLHRLTGVLARRAGLPRTPRLFYVPTRMLNAFAAGRGDDAAIALTDGLLRGLSRRELAGVLAHEIAHLRAHDVRVMQLAEVVGRMTAILAFAGVVLLFAWLPLAAAGGEAPLPLLPILVMMLAPTLSAALQRALARTREYSADLAAAELTGDPRGLALALDKLYRLQGGWMERIFLSRLPKWLRTHPDSHSRIRRLLALETQ